MPEEQKGWRQGSCGAKDQLLIEKRKGTSIYLWLGQTIRKSMTLFHIAASMSAQSYLELQIT